MPLRILVADDHSLSRKGIQTVFRNNPRLRIVGEAVDGFDVLKKAKELQPDLILMDINMPKQSGIEATRKIKEDFPLIKIVMLSVSDDVQDFFEAIKSGAQGYLLKNMDTGYWGDYLIDIFEGKNPVPRPLASKILAEFVGNVSIADEVDCDLLSVREKEVLVLVSQGYSNKEIGERLYISESTVKNHLRSMMEKLQLRNRSQLIAYAFRNKIIKAK